MPVPQLFRQHMNKPDTVIHGALVHRVRCEEPVNVVCTHVGNHLGWWYRSNLHISIRVQPCLGQVVAKQIVVH